MISSYSLFGAFWIFLLVSGIYFVSWCWKPQGHLTPLFGPSCLINDQFLSMEPGLHAFPNILSPGICKIGISCPRFTDRITETRTVPQCPSTAQWWSGDHNPEVSHEPWNSCWNGGKLRSTVLGGGEGRERRKAKRYRKLLQKHHWQIEGNCCDTPITHSRRMLCKNLKKHVSNYGKLLCAIIHKYPEFLHYGGF